MPFEQLATADPKDWTHNFDVIGIVRKVSPKFEFTSKQHKVMQKRNVTLTDGSGKSVYNISVIHSFISIRW